MMSKTKPPIKKNLEEIYEKAKEGISQKWKNPTHSFVENTNNIVQSGISPEDKDLLVNELDEMVEMLEEWKVNNPEDVPRKKAS